MNTVVGCHFLLQGILLTQESNPRLLSPALREDSLPTEPSGFMAMVIVSDYLLPRGL